MNFIDPHKHTRRAFLKRSAQLAIAGSAAPMALNLAAIGEAAALTATDYKALVCVFLYGGNDYANTVVRYDDTGHAQYAQARGAGGGASLVLPKASLSKTELIPSVALANGAIARTNALPVSMETPALA